MLSTQLIMLYYPAKNQSRFGPPHFFSLKRQFGLFYFEFFLGLEVIFLSFLLAFVIPLKYCDSQLKSRG